MKAVLIPGDGIGKEISKSVVDITKAMNLDIEWVEYQAGAEYAVNTKEVFESGLVDAIKEYKWALKGPTATPMLIHNDDKNLLNTLIPLGRFALPEEIANMAVFLVSDMGHTIIGDIIYMTGGAGLVSFEDINYNLDIELKYVHQLQNLHFVLTGKELTIN